MKFTIKHSLYILFMMAGMSACKGQAKSLADQVLQMEDFNFKTKITTLIPEETKDKDYADFFKVKNTTLQKETLYDDELSEDRKPIWTEYRHIQYRIGEEFAKFGNFVFNTVNLVVSLDDEIVLVNGLAGEVTREESDLFIQSLNKKYGEAKQTTGEFMKPFKIYTWTRSDRVIKYVPLFDDESSTVNLVIDKEQKTIERGEKNPHFKGLLYVINGKYSTDVIGEFHTGDLLYCQ